MRKLLENAIEVKAVQSTVPAIAIRSMAHLWVENPNNVQYLDTYKHIHWMFDNIDESVVKAIAKSWYFLRNSK